MENDEINEISIEKLGIDKCNIRGGIWDYDEELVNSIRDNGLIEPLIVRPVINSDDSCEYGIICGSRRYNAAREAQIEKVPCIVKNLNDIDAITVSMIENRQRVDTPKWKDVEAIGMIYHGLKDKNHSEKIQYISIKSGINNITVEKYLKIYALPTEIKGLLRDTKERSLRQKETLLLFQIRASNNTLTLGNAESISELNNKIELNKLIELAVFVLDKSVEITHRLVQYIPLNPTKSIQDIYDEMIKNVYGSHEKMIRFDNETWDAITNACMKRQMIYDRYLRKIIRERLCKEGFLEVSEAITHELAEEEEGLTQIKCSKKLIEKSGYKYLKTQNGQRIYQKPVGKKTGGFLKAFVKGYTTFLKLTPGKYEDESKILREEKNRLLKIKNT